MTRDPHACAVVPTQRKHHPAGVSLRGLCGGSGRGQHGGGMGGLGHNGMHGGGPLVTKSLLVVNSGGRYVEGMVEAAGRITAYDKDTGAYLGSVPLPRRSLRQSRHVSARRKQCIAVAVGTSSGAGGAELIALALPERRGRG